MGRRDRDDDRYQGRPEDPSELGGDAHSPPRIDHGRGFDSSRPDGSSRHHRPDDGRPDLPFGAPSLAKPAPFKETKINRRTGKPFSFQESATYFAQEAARYAALVNAEEQERERQPSPDRRAHSPPARASKAGSPAAKRQRSQSPPRRPSAPSHATPPSSASTLSYNTVSYEPVEREVHSNTTERVLRQLLDQVLTRFGWCLNQRYCSLISRFIAGWQESWESYSGKEYRTFKFDEEAAYFPVPPGGTCWACQRPSRDPSVHARIAASSKRNEERSPAQSRHRSRSPSERDQPSKHRLSSVVVNPKKSR